MSPVSLGDYTVVSGLMEQFCRDILATWDAFTEGKVTQAKAVESAMNLAGEMAAIFKGQDPAYTTAPWRSEGKLEGKIVGWVRSIKGDGDPILDYFKFLATNILKGCAAMQEGMAPEEAGPRIQSILKDAAEKLAGVQP